MITLTVNCRDKNYPISIDSNLLNNATILKPLIKGSQVLIVTDQSVGALYLQKIEKLLVQSVVDTIILPEGEVFKNTDTINLIYDKLMENHHNRTTTLIALGGGVVGDMTGFAAATYQRGVNFIQIPTTLLAQVDSSVGGKTGVNHQLGKNMIGAFHQPEGVIIDIDTLKTLPDREFSAGLAEVIKYGLISDPELFLWLEQHIVQLMARNKEELIYAIQKSCEIKADIVAKDEKELGVRALLNFGHTFAHAIEASQGYGQYLHGEAVAIGMLTAAELSMLLGWVTVDVVDRVRNLLIHASLPTETPKEMEVKDFFDKMAVDKKVTNGKWRLVLLNALGDAVIKEDIDKNMIAQAIQNTRIKQSI